MGEPTPFFARQIETTKRGEVLLELDAEVDLSDDMHDNATLALLRDQRGWSSSHDSGFDFE